jgi:integrase
MSGSVKKRGSKWIAILELGRDECGKRTQRYYSGFATKHAAKERLSELQSDMRTGEYVEPSKATLGKFLRDWLDGRKKSIRPSTWHGYDKIVRCYVAPAIGSYPLQKVTPVILNKLYADLQVNGRRGGKGALSGRTARGVHMVLRRALADAVRQRLVNMNPAELADVPKANAGEMKVWSAGDVRAFLEHMKDDRLYALWLTAATTGMRRGELCGLRWAMVDIDAGRLSVIETLLDVDHKLVAGEPKTKSGRRSIALDHVTVAALRAHQTAQKVERLAFGSGFNDRGLVFVREDGEPIHPAWLSRAFTQRVRAAGVPMIRLHDVRHTAATLSLAAGLHPKVVSERLGHANVAITMDVYSHVLPAMQQDAADKIAAVVFGS